VNLARGGDKAVSGTKGKRSPLHCSDVDVGAARSVDWGGKFADSRRVPEGAAHCLDYSSNLDHLALATEHYSTSITDRLSTTELPLIPLQALRDLSHGSLGSMLAAKTGL